MAYGLPSIGEGNWGQKILDSFGFVKGELDGRLSPSSLSASFVSPVIIRGTGIDPTGVADSTTAVLAKFAQAASEKRPIYFPEGIYQITSSLPWGEEPITSAGQTGVTINFSGAGYCFDHPAMDAKRGMVLAGFTINLVGASSIGGWRLGDRGEATITGYHIQCVIRDLWVYDDAVRSGTVGFSATAVAWSVLENITVQSCETSWIMDRTTANQARMATAQGFHYGPTWTGQATPLAGGQDTTYLLQALGPDAGAPAGAYAMKVDVPNLTQVAPYYETPSGGTGKALVWLTENATGYRETQGRWQPTSTLTNTLVLDAAASNCDIKDVWFSSLGTAPASLVGAPGTGGSFNGKHHISGCDTRFTDTLTAATTAGYVLVEGPVRFTRPGSGLDPLQALGYRGPAIMLPAHIYSDPTETPLTASATIDDATAGKVSMMSGAGATPPTPVVVADSNDRRGRITFGSGSAPSGNQVVRVNFATPFSYTPHVLLTDIQGGAALQPVSISSVTNEYFIVNAPVAASQANTAYSFSYLVEA